MTNPNRSAAVTEIVRDIVVEEVLPHSPEKIWRALTAAELLARWLMPNDFEPVVGKSFNFRTQPMGDWDGVVHCKILEIVPLKRLVYSWRGGSRNNAKYGSELDSVATWTLEVVGAGTRLKLVHSGFRSPENDFAYDAMTSGWGHIMARIAEIAAE